MEIALLAAATLFAVLPVFVLLPFLRKYLIKGLSLGAQVRCSEGTKGTTGRAVMRKLLLGAACWLVAGPVHAQTINILMESVPDTRFVQEVVPEFEQQTGIDVEIEVVNYAEMHTKLVPQLVAPTGSYDVIVVDFYWVGEFTKAGWLQPLDERIQQDNVDTSVYFDLCSTWSARSTASPTCCRSTTTPWG